MHFLSKSVKKVSGVLQGSLETCVIITCLYININYY